MPRDLQLIVMDVSTLVGRAALNGGGPMLRSIARLAQ